MNLFLKRFCTKLILFFSLFNIFSVEFNAMDYENKYVKKAVVKTSLKSITPVAYRTNKYSKKWGGSNMIYPKTKHRLPIINSPYRPYLQWLKDGTKTAEGRVNGPSCRKMEKGDTILFFDDKNKQYISGVIEFKHVYDTFENMLKYEGIRNLLPFLTETATIEDGVKVYKSFPGSNRVKELGCVAIGVKVIDSKL